MKLHLLALCLLFSPVAWSADVPVLNSSLEVVLPDGAIAGDIITSTANTLKAVERGVKPLVTLVELKEAVRLYVESLNAQHAATVTDLAAAKEQAETVLKQTLQTIEPIADLAAKAAADERGTGQGPKSKRLDAISAGMAGAIVTAKRDCSAVAAAERASMEAQIKALQDQLKSLPKP